MPKFGVSVALLTPFDPDGKIDVALLSTHAKAVLGRGAEGVTLFGTTGEGASVGSQERARTVGALVRGGVPATRITLGIATTSVEDACLQIAEAGKLGVGTFLLLPPFYFKGCSEAGLFEWYMQVIAETDPSAKIILYHIPQVTQVPLSPALVARINAAAPGRIRAVKDSAGDWDATQTLLEMRNVPILVGDERHLHKAAALGGDGTICGFSNLYPERLAKVFGTATEDKDLSDEVTRVVAHPVTPALKLLMAAQSGNSAWERLRAPLTPLAEDARAAILSKPEAVH